MLLQIFGQIFTKLEQGMSNTIYLVIVTYMKIGLV